MRLAEPLARVTADPTGARLLLLGCTLVAYSTSLHGPFQFDDFGVIVRYEPVHSLAGWAGDALHGLRPLLKLTYAACWSLGWGPLGFHVVNLLLHLLNIELVLRLYKAAAAAVVVRGPSAEPKPDLGALCAGALFALHPLQTEAITYISGRSSSLSTCFALFAMNAYACTARTKVWSRAYWGGLALALLAYGCAVLSKESAAILPLAMLAWELCLERGDARARLRRQAPFWAMFAGVLVVVVAHPRYYALLYELTGSRSLFASLWYQIDGAGYLLVRLIALHRLSIDPGLGLYPPAVVPAVLAALACAALVLAAVLARGTRPLVSFGLWWFLLHMFLPYVFLPRPDVVNERHMYLAGIGLWLAAGSLLGELQRAGRLRARAWAFGAVLVALMIAMTARRNLDYASPIALWERTVEVSPESPRAHYNLGVSYETEGKLGAAAKQYTRALVLYPPYTAARRALTRIERRAR